MTDLLILASSSCLETGPLRKNDFSDINYLSINLNSGLKITFLINPFTICLFKDADKLSKEMVQ